MPFLPIFVSNRTFIAALMCLALSSCRTINSPGAAKTHVRIAGGGKTLSDIYNRKIPHAVFSTVATEGTAASVDYVQRGLAEVAFTQADIAYQSFLQGASKSDRHGKLRGMASLSIGAVHLFVAPGSDIRSFKDLRGKRIGVGPRGTGSEATVRIVLPKLGIPLSEVHLSLIPFADVPRQLAERSLDAEFFVDSIPSAQAKATVLAGSKRLISLEESAMSKLREEYPFFRPVVIPAGTYGQSEAIKTLGVDTLLVCNEDLDEELVYQMLNIFFDSLPELANTYPPDRGITFDQAPRSPIPLHPGAARFYRAEKLFR
jgi:TRAP transporter TAXI family solute receptor